jgi:hypothetical protein
VGAFTVEEGVTERVRVADLNVDGLLDVVLLIDFPLGIRTRLNLGDGAFGPLQASSAFSDSSFGFAVGDVSGDAIPDAVTGNNNQFDGFNLGLVFGQGNGLFANGTSLNNGSASMPNVTIADVNNDGLGDIVSNTFVDVSVILSLGFESFSEPIESGVADTVGDPILADLNDDGHLDYLQVADSLNQNIADSDVIVNHGNGEGAFAFAQEIQLAVRVGSGFFIPRYALANLNGDDLPDLMVYGLPGTDSGPGGLRLLENIGGTFAVVHSETQAQLGFNTTHASVGDFNGDGLDDVLIVRQFNAMSEIRISDGNFGFSAAVPINDPFEPDAAIVADFVGSPLPDVLFVESPIGPIETFTLYENTTEVPKAVPGDLTGDGQVGPADLAQLLSQWGPCSNPEACPADITGDDAVGPADLAQLLANWG